MANGTLAASQLEMLSQSGTGITTIVPPATNTNRTLTLPDVSGTLSTNGPAFFANGATSASLTAGTNTKVAAFSSEVFDTNSNFDTATSRFTPTVAGYYQVSATVRSDTSLTVFHATLYKNGAAYAAGSFTSLSAGVTNKASTVSALVYLNGSTDYVEIYAFVSATATTSTTAGQTWFSGVLVRTA